MAAEYLKVAAENNHIDAMLLYGEMLLNGCGVEENKSEAVCFIKLAAYHGNKKAMLKYAKMLRHGDGVEQNEKESEKYVDMAFQKNEPQINVECSIC